MQMLEHTVEANFLSGKLQHGVLDNSVLNAVLTQLLTESGIVSYVDTLIINNNTSRGILDLFNQRSNLCLLLFQNLCVWHSLFHLHKSDWDIENALLLKDRRA